MPNVQLVMDENVSPEIKEYWNKIKEKYGEVPPPLRAMANHPTYFKIVQDKMDAIMSSSELDMKTKLAIAFAISTLNNCEFCITMYGKQLRDAGFSDKQLVEIIAMIDLVGSMNHFNNGMLIKH